MPESKYPRFVSLKYANAFKIKAQELTEPRYGAPWKLIPEGVGLEPIIVSSDFMLNYRPDIGGYYVEIGGQPSYLSSDAFEREYSPG